MQKLTVLSDVHIGAQRSAGTTPLTAWQLRQYLLEEFRQLVESAEGDLLILGDLFDTGTIPMADVLATWEILRAWLSRGQKCFLVLGNHDRTRTLTTLSSFQFLCRLLAAQFPEQVQEIDDPVYIKEHDAYVVSSSPNQDIFDAEIAKVPACSLLLLHCNFSNKFAVEADHSLNLTLDQAAKAPAKKIIIAHEHQHRTGINGKVLLPGNQVPSSIADCLGNDVKYKTVVTDGNVELVETWHREGNYAEQDWRSLTDSGEKFIRVVGEAVATEAADVVSAIAKFRNKAKALVITNAVKVEGAADGEQIQITLEQVKSFDVLSALLECLDEREQGVVKALLGAQA